MEQERSHAGGLVGVVELVGGQAVSAVQLPGLRVILRDHDRPRAEPTPYRTGGIGRRVKWDGYDQVDALRNRVAGQEQVVALDRVVGDEGRVRAGREVSRYDDLHTGSAAVRG